MKSPEEETSRSPERREARRGREKTTRVQREDDLTSLCPRPFLGRFLPPFCSAPRPLSAASHRAPTNRETTASPPPSSPHFGGEGMILSRGGPRGSFGREILARAFWAGDLGGRLLPLPRRSSILTA